MHKEHLKVVVILVFLIAGALAVMFDIVSNDSAYTLSSSKVEEASAALPSGAMPAIPDGPFRQKCAGAGVLKCVGFDSPADLRGTYGDNSGMLSGNADPEIDPDVKASGN